METRITAPTLCPPSPLKVPSPPTDPSGRRESLPPLWGQLEFITTSLPQPSLLSLVTSGIQMWKPNRFILKGDQQQGREVAGVCVHLWAVTGLELCFCGAWSHAGDLPWTARVGDWGTGVNRVSGSWTSVCHGPVGATDEAARPGVGKQEGRRAGGVREGNLVPLLTLSRALSPKLPSPTKPSPSSLDEPPGWPATGPCSPPPDQKVFDGIFKNLSWVVQSTPSPW